MNSYLINDPGIDLASWKLTVEGLVSRAETYSLDQLRALPKREQITRHISIEGWAVIGSFAGMPLGKFLDWLGVTPPSVPT